jgi:DNA modification methylase
VSKAKKPYYSHTIVSGDCIKAMAGLAPASINLAIGDPPYNFAQQYEAIEDKKSYADYVAWTESWVAAVHRVLHKHGTLVIFAPDEWVSEIDLMARRKFGFTKRNHIVWYFTFGQAQQLKFTRSHCHILWLTKTKTKFTFNADQIRVPSARQAVYKDTRADAAGKLPDDTWVLYKKQLEPLFSPDADTWLQSRVCGTFDERKRHSPNQLPIPLLERIVLAGSTKGDLVLDPFAGTCASAMPCIQHDRNWIGYDLSKKCVAEGKDRIAKAVKEKK